MTFLKEQLREDKRYFLREENVLVWNFFNLKLKKNFDVLTQWKCFITVLGVSPTVAGVVPNEYQN